MCQIEVEGVKITLTKEQLTQIAKQTNKQSTIDDIQDILTAESILKNCSNHERMFIDDYKRNKDWITYQLETIIKAANFIDNNHKEWKADFNNHSIYLYIPWFEKKSSCNWLIGGVSSSCSAYISISLYYKEINTAEVFQKRFISLYNQWLES